MSVEENAQGGGLGRPIPAHVPLWPRASCWQEGPRRVGPWRQWVPHSSSVEKGVWVFRVVGQQGDSRDVITGDSKDSRAQGRLLTGSTSGPCPKLRTLWLGPSVPLTLPINSQECALTMAARGLAPEEQVTHGQARDATLM